MPRRETPLMFYGVVKGPTQGPDGAPACMAAGSDKAMLGVFFYYFPHGPVRWHHRRREGKEKAGHV